MLILVWFLGSDDETEVCLLFLTLELIFYQRNVNLDRRLRVVTTNYLFGVFLC